MKTFAIPDAAATFRSRSGPTPPSIEDVDSPRTRTFFPETWHFLVNQTEYVEFIYGDNKVSLFNCTALEEGSLLVQLSLIPSLHGLQKHFRSLRKMVWEFLLLLL